MSLPPQGYPEGTGDAHYVFIQSTSSAKWIISHTLAKNPSVTVVDTAGTVVMGNVIYISTSLIHIEFSAPFSGRAYLN